MSRKLKNTKLFSDAQKVELFSLLDEASEADRKKLEAGIDAFDAQYAKAVNLGTQRVKSVLGHAVRDMSAEERAQNKQAIDSLNLGLSLLSPV